MFDTPILLIVFNRPEETEKAINKLQQIRPRKLFVAADKARSRKPDEEILCNQVKEIVANGINWECDLKTLYQTENLGCGRGPSTAISWFFEHIEQGIILEDDCLPDESFFPFCEELLEKYKDEENVMMIAGYNPLEQYESQYSYSFSKIFDVGQCWGWAGWRRAWNHFDYEMKDYPSYREEVLKKQSSSDSKLLERNIARYNSVSMNIDKTDIWDYQWFFMMEYRNACSIRTNTNLIKNIGFGENSTHTTYIYTQEAYTKVKAVTFPLRHPKEIKHDVKFDQAIRNYIFQNRDKAPLVRKIKNKIRALLRVI